MFSCKNAQLHLFVDSPKFLIGYYNECPVFNVTKYHQLVYLKDKRSHLLYSYDSLYRPINVVDSIVLLNTEDKLLLINLNNDSKKQLYNLQTIDAAYSPHDNCIYFNERYDDKIFKFNTLTAIKTELDTRGTFLTVTNNYLFYYEYTYKMDVSAEIDLYRLDLNSGNKKLLATYISEEFVSIAPNGNSFIATNLLDSLSRDAIYDIANSTNSPVNYRTGRDYTGAYYSTEKKKFFYVDTYTLEEQEAK
jgi:hypothetical protein